MNLFHKRLLTLFSVALNIGVVIMAIVMLINHTTSAQERPWRELANIVQRLNLPEAKESAVLNVMKQFKVTIDRYDENLKQARDDILRFLAKKGSLDRNQLHLLAEKVESLENGKSMAFESHVIDLRHQLGNEKGALFFSLLLAHLEAENKTPHR